MKVAPTLEGTIQRWDGRCSLQLVLALSVNSLVWELAVAGG
jgi:hypothetical protein